MADPDRNFSARLSRALLPLWLVLLVAWSMVNGYGFFAGEFEKASPLTVLGMVGSLLLILSGIGLGWSVRRDQR
ncbi:MAG: hypothetical protein M3395_06000 [Chloroflexota bacterium]|nr:hypothetical protein [Chloroflexota bacterium]MDQ3689186.1 hypothetical protein [Chloroflexota bacterium]